MRLLQNIGHKLETLEAFYYSRFGRSYECACGHTAKWKTVLRIYERSYVCALTGTEQLYCPRCWAQAAIQCAWCDGLIVPGNGITLFGPSAGFSIPDHAVPYRHNKQLCLVGCLNCAHLFDLAGYWVMPGTVVKVINPIEQLCGRILYVE